MHKLYLIACAIFFAFLFLVDRTLAQAPAFRYTDTLKLTTGQSMTPAKPTHTGGAVPNLLYSRVKTLAGSGVRGHKDTVAAFASFTSPLSAAVDSKGNIYIADAGANCIRKISVQGVVSTFAGSVKGVAGGVNGQDTTARFNNPTGVTVDNTDNVYVVDNGNSLIRKITSTGFVSTLAGNQNSGATDGSGTNASFNYPYGIAVGSSGQLFIADALNNKIREIIGQNVYTVAGTGIPGFKNGGISGFNATTFNTPKNVAVDKLSNNIYVVDQGNNCVRKFGLFTQVSTTFAIGRFKKPISIALDNLDNVYVSCEDKYNIYKFSSDGKLVDSLNFPAFSGGDLKGYVNSTDTLTKYSGNMGLFWDHNDNLIVTDPNTGYIREVAVNGYSVYPRLPEGLTLDSLGNITGVPKKIMDPKTYTITAHNSSGVSSFNITIGVSAGKQIITFNPVTPVTYGNADFAPGATSNSNLPITYSSDNAKVATIVNNKIHVVAAGTANITANQAANTDYAAATPVTQLLTVKKAPLSASVFHYYKVQSKSNPDVTIYYWGFVKGDTTVNLKTVPVVQSTATKDSPPGDYPLTVGGGVDDNYDFTYNAGKLTVVPPPTITATGSTYIAKGDSVLLTCTPSTGYLYQWYYNGSMIKGATSATYYAKQSGAYTVTTTTDYFTAYSLYLPVSVQLQLPVDNFKLKINSVSCKGDNNGTIFISAKQKLSYVATLMGNNVNKQIPFTDTLTLSKLSPGSYSVCISVDNEIFDQCFQVNITEPKDLSVYSTINKPSNSINLQLDGGSTFNVNLNDHVYTTDKSEITLPLKAGINKIIVTTDKLCQGIIEKTIDMSGITAPYPNPFTGVLSVNIGNSLVSDVRVDVVSVLNGKSVFANKLSNKSGVLQFDLSGVSAGVYYFNLNLDNTKLGYKIIKK